MPYFTAPDGARLYFTDDGPRDAVPVLALAGKPPLRQCSLICVRWPPAAAG